MNFDKEGRLKVSVQGITIYNGSPPISIYNGLTLLTTASSLINFSYPSFLLSASNDTEIFVSPGFSTPSTVGLLNVEGTSSYFARADHIHEHGNLTGSLLHNTASVSSNGFMSSGSYTLLNNLSGSLSLYQLLSEKNQLNGYVGLDSFGKISNSFLSGSNLIVYNTSSLVTNNALSLNFIGFSVSASTADNINIVNTTSGSIGNVFEAYQTASQTIANAPSTTNIKFDFIKLPNSYYTTNLAKDTITFTTAGKYKIEYRVSIANSVNNESSAMSSVFINGSSIPGTFAYSFHRNSTSGTTTAIGFGIVTIAANDTLQIRTQRNSGGGSLVTVANGTNIIITKWI